MPVNDHDLDVARRPTPRHLPDRFDLVHLGLGPDGHTASLIPGDPVLGVRDRLVAVTGVYQGEQRMTLTYRALERAPISCSGSSRAPTSDPRSRRCCVATRRFPRGASRHRASTRDGRRARRWDHEPRRGEAPRRRIAPPSSSSRACASASVPARRSRSCSRRSRGVACRHVTSRPRPRRPTPHDRSVSRGGLRRPRRTGPRDRRGRSDRARRVARQGSRRRTLAREDRRRRGAPLRGHRRLVEAGDATPRAGALGTAAFGLRATLRELGSVTLRDVAHDSRRRRTRGLSRRRSTARTNSPNASPRRPASPPTDSSRQTW